MCTCIFRPCMLMFCVFSSIDTKRVQLSGVIAVFLHWSWQTGVKHHASVVRLLALSDYLEEHCYVVVFTSFCWCLDAACLWASEASFFPVHKVPTKNCSIIWKRGFYLHGESMAALLSLSSQKTEQKEVLVFFLNSEEQVLLSLNQAL